MCNLSQGIEDKGFEKGFKIGFEEGFKIGFEEGYKIGSEKSLVEGLNTRFIKSLTETLNLSVDEAMAALKLPEEDRPRYLELLAQQ